MKSVVIAAVLLCAAGFLSGQAFEDARLILTDLAETYQLFFDEIEEAESGEEIALAINEFVVAIEELTPMLSEIDEKYPEIQDMTQPPEELAEIIERLTVLGNSIHVPLLKIFSFAEDAAVVEAIERLRIFE